eukprot:m.301502 g.301502  ORF g.301502 m.301502 type:complete len:613 (-) comp27276_c1_seq6:320-2158(-)
MCRSQGIVSLAAVLFALTFYTASRRLARATPAARLIPGSSQEPAGLGWLFVTNTSHVAEDPRPDARSKQHDRFGNQPVRSIVFDGADAPLQALRAAARARIVPGGCDHPLDRRVPVIRDTCLTRGKDNVSKCVPIYGHGGEGRDNWFGHAYPSAHDSCGFTSVLFRPTANTITHILDRQVYMTSGHNRNQCKEMFGSKKGSKGVETAITCMANNFPIDVLSKEECLDRSSNAKTNKTTLERTDRFNCTGPTCMVQMRFGDAQLPGLARLGATSHGVLPHPPYLVYAQNAVVAHNVRTINESYILACAPYWLPAANFKNNDPRTAKDLQQRCQAPSGEADTCPFPRHKKVVFLSQIFAGEYFHFVMEIWPRIAPFIEAFRRDPDLVFHTSSESKEDSAKTLAMQASFYELLGIPRERLVSETVFAEEVIIPQVGYSHNPILNLWPTLALRDDLEHRHGVSAKPAHITQSSRPLVVVAIVRDSGRRQDRSYYTDAWAEGLEARLPRHRVILFKSSNATMLQCLPCQIEQFQHADVVVGSHGAGLVHLLWVPPRATVVEILDGGSMIFREVALMLGHKYVILPHRSPVDDVANIIRVADKQNEGALHRTAVAGVL